MVALLATVCPCQERDFAADLAALERSAERGQWKVAERKLASLLEKHRDAEYARRERVRITELAKQCAFHLSFPRPKPEEVVSGELLTYNAATGRIRIRYQPTTLDDFLVSSRTPLSTGTYVHPLIFDGNHSITVKGQRYPRSGASFVVCATEDLAYRVVMGARVKIERRAALRWQTRYSGQEREG